MTTPSSTRTKADTTTPARMPRASAAAIKRAELASALGAIVLGAGMALAAPQWLRAYAPILLGIGLLVHGAGMTLKYRLESREGPPVWWERVLFWLCWICLTLLAAWIAARVTIR